MNNFPAVVVTSLNISGVSSKVKLAVAQYYNSH